MEHLNLSQGHFVTNKVDVYLNVLRATMMYWVGSHIDGADVVTVDDRC